MAKESLAVVLFMMILYIAAVSVTLLTVKRGKYKAVLLAFAPWLLVLLAYCIQLYVHSQCPPETMTHLLEAAPAVCEMEYRGMGFTVFGALHVAALVLGVLIFRFSGKTPT